jgi:hypothetical protein
LELIVKSAWFVLAAIHAVPALVIFKPSLIEKLYGVPASGPIGLLLTHRGGLFLAMSCAGIIAALHTPSRPLAAAIISISMVSFLILYVRAGMPGGGLRNIAIADAVGLPLLILVI